MNFLVNPINFCLESIFLLVFQVEESIETTTREVGIVDAEIERQKWGGIVDLSTTSWLNTNDSAQQLFMKLLHGDISHSVNLSDNFHSE